MDEFKGIHEYCSMMEEEERIVRYCCQNTPALIIGNVDIVGKNV